MHSSLLRLGLSFLALFVAAGSIAPAAWSASGNLVTICHIPPGNTDNARTLQVDESAVDAHLAHGDHLGACGSLFPHFVVDAKGNRTYGTTATNFEFTAVVPPEVAGEIAEFTWETDDGRSFSGPEISLDFDEPGFHSIVLTATSITGEIETAETGVIVHQDGQLAPSALDIPEPIGDVNNDGSVSLVDAHLAAKFAGRLDPLPGQRSRLAADIDFSGDVTFQDVEIIAETVLSGNSLADRLLRSSGAPGALVTIVSHHLVDPEAFIEISIGEDDQRQTVNRPILGYATFIMPFTGAASEPGEQEVRLLVNGSEASSYEFSVTQPEPLPDDPVAELVTFFNELEALLEINESLLIEQLDTVPLPEESREALLATAAGGRIETQRILAELETLLGTSEGQALAEVFFETANANGLPEVRDRLQAFLQSVQHDDSGLFSTAAFSPDEVCDELLPALCALQTTTDLIDRVSGIASTSCDVTLAAGIGGSVTGIATKPSALALLGWAKICAPLELTLDVGGTVSDLISDIDQSLQTEVDNRAPEPGEAATITAKLEVFGLDDVCQLGGSFGSEKLVEKLAERAVNRMLRRKITMRAVERVFTLLGEEILQEFFGLLELGAEKVITGSQLDQAILDFATPYCDNIFGAELIINASRVMGRPQPDVGTLSFLANGTAQYICPEDPDEVPEEGVQFDIEKQICDEQQSRTEIIQCGEMRDVTITMGDNGALNDDIFEVLLEGESVLTSSSPVRSISTTVQLPAGSTASVQMLGRAAPDGIGTYYITFEGATVISGSATSGSDLVPGAVKSFTIQVQQ